MQLNGHEPGGEATTVLVGGAESYEARCRSCFEARDVTPTREPGL